MRDKADNTPDNGTTTAMNRPWRVLKMTDAGVDRRTTCSCLTTFTSTTFTLQRCTCDSIAPWSNSGTGSDGAKFVHAHRSGPP